MKNHIKTVAAAAVVFAAGLGATAVTAQTLGEQVDAGVISPAAFAQLVGGSGLTENEARGISLSDLVAIKWSDD